MKMIEAGKTSRGRHRAAHGEACGLGYRILCDITAQGKRFW